jgi:hypothetical protein
MVLSATQRHGRISKTSRLIQTPDDFDGPVTTLGQRGSDFARHKRPRQTGWRTPREQVVEALDHYFS